MAQFNERVILIRSLVALFTIQLAIAGYQSLACYNSRPNSLELCSKSNENLIETSKSVANVFLALLVPAAASTSRPSRSTKSRQSDNTPPEG